MKSVLFRSLRDLTEHQTRLPAGVSLWASTGRPNRIFIEHVLLRDASWALSVPGSRYSSPSGSCLQGDSTCSTRLLCLRRWNVLHINAKLWHQNTELQLINHLWSVQLVYMLNCTNKWGPITPLIWSQLLTAPKESLTKGWAAYKLGNEVVLQRYLSPNTRSYDRDKVHSNISST